MPLKHEVGLSASLLLQHLLNQSLSGLDFCLTWQELSLKHPELEEVDGFVKEFLETSSLGALDRALALLPQPQIDLQGRLPKLEMEEQRVGYDSWEVKSQRIREVSRADFRCRSCGWEITLSQEHEANTEMRLPFDRLDCPFCPPLDSGTETPG